MEKINKEEFEKAKNIDPLFVVELVKQFKNDSELGSAIRRYVLLTNSL